MKLKTCSRGDILFRQGDFENGMYYINAGKVGIYANYGTPDQEKLEELYPDQFVGDMGMLNDEPRSATAVVLVDETDLEYLTEEDFEDFFRTNPARVFQLMQQLSYRIRKRTRMYLAACRTAHELVEKEQAAFAADV